MDVNATESDASFRNDVRRFLGESLPPNLKRAGERTTSIFSDFDAMLAWQKILHARGWAAPDWPTEYGGAGWSITRKNIFREECVRASTPAMSSLGIQMLGPILIRYGSEQQKRDLLPKILSGEDVWCQGYSEPEAGSDLASLKTRAIRQGDHYVVNGSKIWTSLAQHANKIFCLVRTSDEGKLQAGISFLLIDMDAPGVEVSPIVSLDGEVEQCQIFFNEVKAPVENRVGEEGQGWEIARSLLEFERGGYCYFINIEKQLRRLKTLMAETEDNDGISYANDEVFRQKFAELQVENLALQSLEMRMQGEGEAAKNHGALSSLPKLVGTVLSQKIDELLLEIRGVYVSPFQNSVLSPDYEGEVIGGEKGAFIMNSYLNNRGATIYGGTAQIQRNIIAKSILGL